MLQISQATKDIWKVLQVILWAFIQIWWNMIQEYVSEGISHPFFYRDLFYKLRRVKCEANVVSFSSKIVKRFRRLDYYDQVIIERTTCLVFVPSTALYKFFLKHSTLTNNAVRTIWRDLSKTSLRIQGPGSRPLWLLVATPSVLGPELASRRAKYSILWRMSLYIFDVLFYNLTCFCNIFMASPLWLAVGPWSF